MLTQERLKEVLYYEPTTGEFSHKIYRVGSTSTPGYIKKDGYRYIMIDRRKYIAQRLAWLYVYGEWPRNQIDHINGIKTDNRICNLRDVSCRENQNNQRCHRNGKLPGGDFHPSVGKWRARIRIGSNRKMIGYFNTEIEAYEAYVMEKERANG